MPERITGTEFSPRHSANVVHGGVELCALTSSLRTQDEQRRKHSKISRLRTESGAISRGSQSRVYGERSMAERIYQKCKF